MRFTYLFGLILLIALSHNSVVQAQPLVQVQWLESRLENEEIVILDIRSPRKSRDFYAEGHIQGAVSAPYNSGWRKTIDGVIGMLPPVDEISSHIGGLGVGNQSHVVIVPFGNSSTDFAAATRVYWTFKVLGHTKVSILEGGYAAWLASGLRLSREPTVLSKQNFVADFQSQLLASEEEVQKSIGANVSLIDARPTAQFEGKAKSPVVARAGTLPKAMNLRQSTLYSPRKARFLTEDEINASTAKIGISSDEKSITFCNTGHWASIAWFALSEISGQENVSLYDGSMAEWTITVDNPIQ
ncbi:MAG: sulfurtransferase [Pseudomonadota bacterium]